MAEEVQGLSEKRNLYHWDEIKGKTLDNLPESFEIEIHHGAFSGAGSIVLGTVRIAPKPVMLINTLQDDAQMLRYGAAILNDKLIPDLIGAKQDKEEYRLTPVTLTLGDKHWTVGIEANPAIPCSWPLKIIRMIEDTKVLPIV